MASTKPQTTHRLRGVLCPVVTPFKADLAPDNERFIHHCRWLLKHGCSGLAIFGTNSEANSLSLDEKLSLLTTLVHAGVPGAALMPGTGHCDLPTTVRLTANAITLGCAGVLMLPPFYYKGVSDEGLYRYFSEVIERVHDARLRLYLYHIPSVSQVPITLKLIRRLITKYPGIVAGVKDSSSDWSNTRMMLDEFAKDGFDIFVGSETFLLDNMRNGGVGCITATGNVNPGPIDHVYHDWHSSDSEERQAGIAATRKIFQKYPMIPALKSVIAHFGNDPQWRSVRPPLTGLDKDEESQLIRELKAAKFVMPGLTG
ncbi:MAG TPA: dihydrodipicolinate synthase family protein [Gammaproteobacteria bacterium]|nr:dihydrodipicolinate synthase family protein [Gammaproteobacteria bacterium]